MKTLTLNSVYAQSGMMPLDNEIKFDRIVRDSINAGILAKTDNARQIDKAGNLTGIDHKALTDECATYIACALPAFAKGVIKQYNDAVIAAKGATTDTEKQAAKVLLARAEARLPTVGDAKYLDLSFLTMSASEFKSFEHAEKKTLAKYRDDKRGILRMNFRRLVEAAHNLNKAVSNKDESWTEILARVYKSFTGEKTAPKWIKAGIKPDDLAHAFLILEKGRKFAESAKLQQAAKNGKAAAKQAAK
jgi:hypothetical protein